MKKRIMNTSGNSMYNVIANGDKILVSTSSFNAKFGDVIVYDSKHGYVAHRFYFHFFNYAITAGDNCRRFEFINKEKIFGKVEYVIKNNGCYKISDKNDIRTFYTFFLIFFILVNNYTFDSIRKTSKSRYIKLKQRLCKFIYKKRNDYQQHYLDNSKV